MKIKSFASGNEYIVGQFYVDAITLALHFQATEAIPGWESRNYGSAVTAKISSDIEAAMLGLTGALGLLPERTSFTSSGRIYYACSIRPDGRHFQVKGPMINRGYGFAGNLEFTTKQVEPKAPPKPVTRHTSLANTGASYVIGQVRLGVTGDHNEEKWVHMQAKEQIEGWEPREYGSSKDVRVGRKVVEQLTSIFDNDEYEDPESLAGTGKQYMIVYIRQDGKHFQLPTVDSIINRDYGFAFDEKPKA